jgi:cytochrome c-type biogenesis protein CcmE
MKKGSKFIVAGIIVIVAIVYLTVSGFKQSSVYYLEVHELINNPGVYKSKGVRISGDIKDGTTKKDLHKKYLEFIMEDETGATMKVVYRGLVPDAYEEGNQVIVEGKYDKTTNTFNANTLLVKCPSKYEAEVTEDGKIKK